MTKDCQGSYGERELTFEGKKKRSQARDRPADIFRAAAGHSYHAATAQSSLRAAAARVYRAAAGKQLPSWSTSSEFVAIQVKVKLRCAHF